jgi:hypothetical protein
MKPPSHPPQKVTDLSYNQLNTPDNVRKSILNMQLFEDLPKNQKDAYISCREILFALMGQAYDQGVFSDDENTSSPPWQEILTPIKHSCFFDSVYADNFHISLVLWWYQKSGGEDVSYLIQTLDEKTLPSPTKKQSSLNWVQKGVAAHFTYLMQQNGMSKRQALLMGEEFTSVSKTVIERLLPSVEIAYQPSDLHQQINLPRIYQTLMLCELTEKAATIERMAGQKRHAKRAKHFEKSHEIFIQAILSLAVEAKTTLGTDIARLPQEGIRTLIETLNETSSIKSLLETAALLNALVLMKQLIPERYEKILHK